LRTVSEEVWDYSLPGFPKEKSSCAETLSLALAPAPVVKSSNSERLQRRLHDALPQTARLTASMVYWRMFSTVACAIGHREPDERFLQQSGARHNQCRPQSYAEEWPDFFDYDHEHHFELV